MAPKEINKNSLTIRHLPQKSRVEEINPSQGTLNLEITCEKEIQGGIGMGVLSDGTPFLNQRGLAALCGVQNAHIGNIGTEWNDDPPRPRAAKIKELLADKGIAVESPFISLRKDNKPYYAYPDTVSLAILEYYAFDAGQNCQPEARHNFRRLAGKALQDFIYAQVGYDPNNAIPLAWRQFHDRVTLNYDRVPAGYFSIFKEIADIIVSLIRVGAPVGPEFVPDISIGAHWGKYWIENEFAAQYGERKRYPHDYPSNFPQAKSNPQPAYCYPDAALPAFRKWFRFVYLAKHYPAYLATKERQGALPPSVTRLCIAAIENRDVVPLLGRKD